MKSLSSVALGLSLVFVCLLLALVAELYYLFWWKKRKTIRPTQDGYNSRKDSWKNPSSPRTPSLQEIYSSDTHELRESQAQNHVSLNNDLEDSIESELMRLHQMSGPPRFLSTIKEETKEDLESEGDRSRKGSKSRSLADLFHTVETPFSTPLASPPCFSPNQHGLNPLFESESDAEFNRLRASPPPTFQFLRDAEEKFHRRKLMEDAQNGDHKINGEYSVHVGNGDAKDPSSSMLPKDEENGSLITIIVGKNNERAHGKHHNVEQYCHVPSSEPQPCNAGHYKYPSSSSQVLPLASSPPKSTLASNKEAFLNQKLHQINHSCS